MTLARLGRRALRFERPVNAGARALLDAVRAWPGVVDATLTERYVGVYFATDIDAGAYAARALSLDDLPRSTAPSREHAFEARYDGEDLAAVAAEIGATMSELVALHTSVIYEVLFLGFMPGFGYLGGLPKRLHVSRLATPRIRVPKNSIAIAGPYSGVYPFASPGGWRLLGTLVHAELFGDAGALLEPGDRVRFRQA